MGYNRIRHSQSFFNKIFYSQQLFPSGAQWKQSAAEIRPLRIPTFVHKYPMDHAFYTWTVDLWALGSLVLKLNGHDLYPATSRRELKYFPKIFINRFGRIPENLVYEMKWSVPDQWQQKSPAASCQRIFEPLPKVNLAYYSFDPSFKQVLENTLALDPRSRSRASDLAEALDPVERTLTMGAV